MRATSFLSSVAGALSLLLAGHALAQAPVTDPRKMEARITRIERSLSSSSLLQMHRTMQNLEREVRELRGEIELQRHEIGQLKQSQRDLYLDVDKRLQAMESAPAGSLAGAVPPTTGEPPAGPGAVPAPVPAPGPAPSPAATPGTPPAVPPGTVVATAPPAALATPPTPAASADPAAEQQAYRAAFELLKGGQFAEASTALGAFLAQYPNGRFADNAQYWLGESFYVSRKFDPALQAFEKLLQEYPDSPKHSHALLKIGFIHDEQGRKNEARQVLTDLTTRFPQSTAAGLARKRLRRLGKP